MTIGVTYKSKHLSPANVLVGASLSAGAGALAATLLGPVVAPIGAAGGAVFGVSFFAASSLSRWIIDKIGCRPGSREGKIVSATLSILASIVAATTVTSAMHFPITVITGSCMAVAMTATTIGITLAIGGCLCCAAVISAIVMGEPSLLANP